MKTEPTTTNLPVPNCNCPDCNDARNTAPQPQRSELKDHGTGYGRSVSGFPREQPPATVGDLVESVSDQLAGQPPCTDDKQWTDHWFWCLAIGTERAKIIRDAHNAELKAERENVTTLLDRAAIVEKELSTLRQQLAAERERAEYNATQIEINENQIQRIEKDLLQAQAAIAEHNEERYPAFREITVDLSALDKYVAEKTKPLLDALRLVTGISSIPKEYGYVVGPEFDVARKAAVAAIADATCPSSNSAVVEE